MKVCTLGTGYVGLVTSSCLAEIGHEVIALDVDSAKIAALQAGRMPIYEPGLPELVAPNVAAGRLSFSTDIRAGVLASDICFITVGTPQGEDGSADMTYVASAAAEIARSIDRYKIIVDKSTMPVGSTKKVTAIINENMPVPHEFDVVSNPEFLREGSAVEDFLHPDRIVIGADSQKAAGMMTELYAPVRAPLMITDPASAETIKYASNCFLAAKVSFINAMANICDCVGADVKEVALGMGYDKRIGFEFLRAGPGFGGSCFPKDVKAMVKIAEENGYDFHLLKGVLEVNKQQKERISRRIIAMAPVAPARVAALGVAFKPNTDDMRDAPALDILPRLIGAGHKVVAFDPVAAENAKGLLPDVDFVRSAEEALTEADIAVVLTEWEEFKALDWRHAKDLLRHPYVFDARNCLDPQSLRKLGFTYQGVGR